MNGFISLHRQFIEWEWYQDQNTMRLFIHCLLMANWKDKRWKGQVIKRGSFVTSQEKLAEQLDLTRSAIRVALDKLKKTGEIQTNGQINTVVTVCKYDSYQDIDRNNSQSVANEQPMNSQSVANEQPLLNKEIKKQSNNNAKLRFNEFWDAYALKKDRKKCEQKFVKLKELDQIKAIAHAKEYREHHERVGKMEFYPNPTTYLNNERWNDEQMPYEHLDKGKPIVYDEEYKQNEFKYLLQ